MPKLNKASRGKASSLATLVAEVDLNPKKKKCEFSCLILVLNFMLSSFAHMKRVRMREAQLREEEVQPVNSGLS